LTQEKFAFKCNVSASGYGQIEEKRKAGISSDETLCKIAISLDVSGLFLLDMENPQYIEKSSLKIVVKFTKVT